jgi:NAD-dependent dihydropyrimidine dehydrogenase PreA subunit
MAGSDLYGVFIEVSIEDAVASDAAIAAKLEEVCPVDIFAVVDGKAAVVTENTDECVLCGLCIEAAPSGGVTVRKLYDDSVLD